MFSLNTLTGASDISSELFLRPKWEAFVFITTEPEDYKTAFDDLKQIEDVQELYLSPGVYDIIAKVKSNP